MGTQPAGGAPHGLGRRLGAFTAGLLRTLEFSLNSLTQRMINSRTLTDSRVEWSISKLLLQPHKKYNITQYGEFGFSLLTQMKDWLGQCTFWDYSHRLSWASGSGDWVTTPYASTWNKQYLYSLTLLTVSYSLFWQELCTLAQGAPSCRQERASQLGRQNCTWKMGRAHEKQIARGSVAGHHAAPIASFDPGSMKTTFISIPHTLSF